MTRGERRRGRGAGRDGDYADAPDVECFEELGNQVGLLLDRPAAAQRGAEMAGARRAEDPERIVLQPAREQPALVRAAESGVDGQDEPSVDRRGGASLIVVTAADTGRIEGDLRFWAPSRIQALVSPVGQAMINTMLIGGADIPEVAEAKRRFFDDRLRRAQPMVARAIQRGELPHDTDPIQLLKTVIAPTYLQLLVTAEPIDEATAELAAAVALAAARAGVLPVTRG
jgi:hypothetical protein